MKEAAILPTSVHEMAGTMKKLCNKHNQGVLGCYRHAASYFA